MTPHQLFTAGALRLRNSGLVAVDFFDDVSDDYGAEDKGIIGSEEQQRVEIPSTQPQVAYEDSARHELEQSVNPLTVSENFGIEQALNFYDVHATKYFVHVRPRAILCVAMALEVLYEFENSRRRIVAM